MGLFGIGTWQSISGGTTYREGMRTQLFQNIDPYSSVYGGTYGFGLYTNIRAPQEVMWTPAPEIGLDLVGTSVVRGYPQMTWSYHQMRPDYWYWLKFIYKQSAYNQPQFQYLVLLQYPDSTQGNTLTQTLARMDPPIQNNRGAAAYTGIQLKFTYIGQFALAPGTPIVVIA
jgi:hypothetical protein